MTDERLAGCRAKIGRAREHLHVLQASIESFVLDGDAYAVTKEANAELGEYSFRLRVRRQPPLVAWSLLIGDCLHNARSALDHLMWQLVLLKHPEGLKDPTINFPILRDPTTFNGRKQKLRDWVGDDALARLERMQPFNGAGPDDNALLFLHSRDITDKHRLLLPSLSVPENFHWAFMVADEKAPMPDLSRSIVFVGRPLEDGTEVARIVIDPPQAIVDVHFQVSINVIFEAPPPKVWIVGPSLEALIGVVEMTVAEFGPFFSHEDAPGTSTS